MGGGGHGEIGMYIPPMHLCAMYMYIFIEYTIIQRSCAYTQLHTLVEAHTHSATATNTSHYCAVQTAR
jgi:hypothetical protein